MRGFRDRCYDGDGGGIASFDRVGAALFPGSWRGPGAVKNFNEMCGNFLPDFLKFFSITGNYLIFSTRNIFSSGLRCLKRETFCRVLLLCTCRYSGAKQGVAQRLTAELGGGGIVWIFNGG